jgi:UDP-N-acetylmuramoyl-L-alanyl-D-glutamate--2,6-diaminopimelate ligase
MVAKAGRFQLRIDELKNSLAVIAFSGSGEIQITDVTHDSRQCGPGVVFVAIGGDKVDGNGFVRQSIELGAIGVISERQAPPGVEVAWIQVPDARRALSRAAAAVHGYPARKLKLVGITGTNGKTTTAHLLDSIIKRGEGQSAMLGTISYRVGDEVTEAHHTTPEASDIQRFLSRAVTAGCRSAVMEISSHAIELMRADDLALTAAVFTNLTRDHLDYHKSMDAYFDAKAKLFDGRLGTTPSASIINVDDEYGRKLASRAAGRIISYGLGDAEVRAVKYFTSERGLEISAETPGGRIEFQSGLVGRPHVYNILAATAAALALGFAPESIAEGVADCRIVAGRFEQLVAEAATRRGFRVVVDYAHTDDALLNVLTTAREITGEAGRVITVFGCGGDRDRTKRAPMGEIAGRLSDVVIVTSDNPRSEDPESIISQIEPGLKQSTSRYLKISDRREAIFRAVQEARAGDLVLIAGKGHETYQIIGSTRAHFDDREVAREALESLGTGTNATA